MTKSKWIFLIGVYLCNVPTLVQPSQATKLTPPLPKENTGFFRSNKYKILIIGTAIGAYAIFHYLRIRPSPEQHNLNYLINIPPNEILYQITDQEYNQALQRSWDKFPGKKNSTNQALNFIGVEGMVNKLFDQLALFEQWKEHNDRASFLDPGLHYDWWVFPIPYVSINGGTKYATFGKDLELIQKSIYKGKVEKYKNWPYLKGQKRATELVLWAIGFWDDDKKSITGQVCHMYIPERLAKILHGTLLANKEMYQIANALLSIIRNKSPKSYPTFADPYFTDIGLDNRE